jgi:hypothetical protein
MAGKDGGLSLGDLVTTITSHDVNGESGWIGEVVGVIEDGGPPHGTRYLVKFVDPKGGRDFLRTFWWEYIICVQKEFEG